jgi:Ca2+-binding EF-hand superfamily protein
MDVTKIPFEERFKTQPPTRTGAQEAATRVYNRNGILCRSDPHVGPTDRFGNSFKPNTFAETVTEPQFAATATPPQVAARTPPVERLRRAGTAERFAQFREKILERGGSAGIHSLSRIFRLMDENDDRRISPEELQLGLEHYGLPMSADEVAQLIGPIDKDKSGTIRLGEFLIAIRGTINQRRQKMIDMAFKVLDKSGNGVITIDDIQSSYNVSHDPDVLAGNIPPDQALECFLSMFDSIDRDGTVTRKEFTEYYRNVSASIDNDDYFELMIRNAWHIPGGEGWCENTSNARILVVTNDNSQKVVMIRNDLGLDLHDRGAVLAALKAQGETNVKNFQLSGEV